MTIKTTTRTDADLRAAIRGRITFGAIILAIPTC
jgi:hypothetical protein